MNTTTLRALQIKLAHKMMTSAKRVTTPFGCFGARLPNGVVFLFFKNDSGEWEAQGATSGQVIKLT